MYVYSYEQMPVVYIYLAAWSSSVARFAVQKHPVACALPVVQVLTGVTVEQMAQPVAVVYI